MLYILCFCIVFVLFFILFLLLYIAVSFLYSYKSTDRCQKVETQMQTISIISYHIYHIVISYHIISYHIISYHIISYHIISYHIISYHIISYHSAIMFVTWPPIWLKKLIRNYVIIVGLVISWPVIVWRLRFFIHKLDTITRQGVTNPTIFM